MKAVRRILAMSTVSVLLSSGLGFAQDHHDDRDHHDQGHYDHDRGHGHYVHHSDWRAGHRMDHRDWDRGERIDWHSHHLRRPPSGYEWREVDGNYVLAAVATGLIASVIIAANSH